MERHWYVLCTKNKQEKKVAAALTKKGIESYCAFTGTEVKNGSQKTRQLVPLFKSFVFVHISKTTIPALLKTAGVVNLAYWKSKPVVVSAEEIDAIKLMEENYQHIQLNKVPVSLDKKMYVQKESITDFGGTVVSIKHKGLIITLPTLGYQMVARVQREQLNEKVKKGVTAGLLPKILNPLSLFGF
ncbi:MAG: transcription termination/antitermination NusG family protein [Ferruginibacter sp.]